VLKDGKCQGTKLVKNLDTKTVIKLMVGRDLDEQQYQSAVQDEIVLETKKLSGQAFNEICFKLKKGEILGLSGLMGAGRTEVARAIVGADPILSGELLVKNHAVEFKHSADSMKAGVVYLSEHRKELGLFLQMSVKENLLVSSMVSASSKGMVNTKRANQISNECIERLNISTPSIEQEVTNLSGGNQQKVLLGRCLLTKPEILIIDEPTQGVDVGAKAEIYEILRKLTQNGTSILLISSELPEVLTLCDRILVMCNGILTAEFSREDATEDEIIHYASGLKTMYA
jgi:ABC-type sugar transport system ATPase subunit